MSEKKDRVIAIRKAKKLNQTEFGEKIGLGQHAISHIEKGNNNLSPRNAELICQKFNVNPRWLETGEGEMFNPDPEDDFLDKLARDKGLDDDEKALIGSIIDLPREARQAVISWAFNLVTRIEVQIEDKTEEERKAEARAIRKRMAEDQKRLDELERGVAPYVEDISTGAGGDYDS